VHFRSESFETGLLFGTVTTFASLTLVFFMAIFKNNRNDVNITD